MEDEKKTEECKLCHMEPIMIGLGTANTVCSMIEDKEQRKDCLTWVDELQPDEIKSAKDIYKGLLERGGEDGIARLDKAAQMFNTFAKEAIVEHVNEKLARGEKPSDTEMKAYKQIMSKKGV